MNKPPPISEIISGGQTGVDRAAFDIALELAIPHSGWCPRGRLAEDGTIAAHYNVRETPTEVYGQRTEWNVRDSDGTFILVVGAAEGGTQLTVDFALQYKKPYRIVQLLDPADISGFAEWIAVHGIRRLNIAGHRESFRPGVIYSESIRHLRDLLVSE